MARREPRPIIPIRQLAGLLGELESTVMDTVEGQAMLTIMNELEAQAVELAPVEFGDLESSTSVKVDVTAGGKIRGTLAFGTPYAAFQHELPATGTEWGPATLAKPGNEYGPAGPKYLERPLLGMVRRFTEDLGGEVRKALSKVKVLRG